VPFITEADGGKIKPLNYHHEYSEHQTMELLRCVEDPIYFIRNYVKILHPTKGAMMFDLRDYQEDLINVYNDNLRTVSLLSRQTGKSTTAAAYLLWIVMFHELQEVLVLSKDKSGSLEIMTRLFYAYEEMPWWLKSGIASDQVHTKKFENGSKITALATTKSSGRGRSPSLIYIDELAFVAPNIAKEMWASILPSIATGGRAIITSTPNVDTDLFAQIWFNARMCSVSDVWDDKNLARDIRSEDAEEYETIFESEDLKDDSRFMDYIPQAEQEDAEDEDKIEFVGFYAKWTRAPDEVNGGFRGPKFKRQTLAAGTSLEVFLREYECSFVSGDATLISAQKLAILNKLVRPPKFIDRWGCRWFAEIKPNVGYAVAMDPSGGVGLDQAVIQVLEIPSLVQVAEWNDNNSDQREQALMLKRILKRLYIVQQNNPDHSGEVNIYYSVERNGLGIGILNIIEMEGEGTFPGWLLDSSETSINVRGESMGGGQMNKWRGLITTAGSKKRYCLEYKSVVERNLFTPRSVLLANEMKSFVKKGNSWAAKTGMNDDIVMSMVLALMLIDEIRFHEPGLEDYLRLNMDEDYHPDDPHDPDNMPFLPIL